jgi:26S proteasome regulatory subunit T1
MSVERDIRFELLARLCPNTTGAELRSVCTEVCFLPPGRAGVFPVGSRVRGIQAGMYAIRARRKVATEKDFLDAINKVIKGNAKFSSVSKYLAYN